MIGMPAKKADVHEFDEQVVAGRDAKARVDACRRALRILFTKPALPAALLEDYAAIAAFLMGPDIAYELFDLDTIVNPAATAVAAAGGANTSVSKVLRQLLVPAGFANIGGVYFVGDAGAAFARVVTGKMLFVDGLSFVHGEFSHSIQWLLIHHAHSKGTLELTTPVADLYRHSVEYVSVYELAAEKGGGVIPKQIAVWDFCVDCFVPRSGEQQCNLLKSVFSDTARSPAWIQRQLTRGAARETTLGRLLAERDARRMVGPRTLTDVRADALAPGTNVGPDDLAPIYRDRARATMAHRPRVAFPNEPGALVPDPLFAHRGEPKHQAIKAAAAEGVFNEQEVKALYDRGQKAKQHLKKATDPLEREWLQLYDQ
jgi:hypothetical protein